MILNATNWAKASNIPLVAVDMIPVWYSPGLHEWEQFIYGYIDRIPTLALTAHYYA